MAILISGPRVILRDCALSDLDRYLYWQDHGEWREYDAPWEGGPGSLKPERLEKLRQRFVERCQEDLPVPRTYAIVADRDSCPLGWVSRYAQEDVPNTLFVGIDLCEDDRLNQGLGTEALRLWVDYQFSNTGIPRIGLETWSFNPRMIRVAEKAGFVLETIKRQAIEWQEEQLDLHVFALRREDWEARATQ
jgi:RimJ/RimL family protein N-acetyltransferase